MQRAFDACGRQCPRTGLRFLIGLSLVAGVRGFTCPPANYEDKTDMVQLDGGKVFIPIFKHLPPKGNKPKVAIIALHGAGRNGDNYFGWVTNAMIKHGQEHETVVVAPTFPDSDCSAADWLGREDVHGRAAKWTHGTRQWVMGQTSDGWDEYEGISSFEALDDLVEWVELRFKRLRKIVVTGFSAGAQMGLRWAILSPHGAKGTTLGGTPLTIMLGSPSSVTYLNNRRPAKSCSEPTDQGVNHTCRLYLVPKKEPDAAKSCRGHWNTYGFGIDGLGRGESENGTIQYDVSNYVHKYITDDSLLKKTIVQHFASKKVVFNFGTADTKDCFVGACAKDCEAMDQGTSRLQRGLNYMGHLADALPGYKPQYSLFVGGHRPELFFAGDHFNRVVFEEGGWDECLWDSFDCLSILVKVLIAGALLLTFSFGGCVFLCMHRMHQNLMSEVVLDTPGGKGDRSFRLLP